MSETVSLDFELKSPIERVWHALTDSAMLSKWTFFDTDDFQPVVGHKFQFRAKPAYGGDAIIIHCEVLEVDKPHRLSYTWVGGPANNIVHTKVTWTLTETDDGVTRLHLEQSGFDPEAKQAIGGAKYGWTQMLNQLHSLLASSPAR
ncbi:MAG: SRPBCC domain-containing protein [Chloroflexi bacterium]|nr:SRPBCC domain-containing protein [Chloroflexota bacterium]